MPSEMRMTVMWNPSAGSAQSAQDLKSTLGLRDRTIICEPGDRETAIVETVKAVTDGADVVVAAGGDGTVSSVVEGLTQSPRPATLGILPLGTGNDLARSLGISLLPAEAMQTLVSGRPRPLDVVEFTSSTGRRTSANMMTAGNSGRYLQQMTDEIKQRWGPLAYLRGVIDVLNDLQTYSIEVCCDDGPVEKFDALNVFIANGRFSGGGLAVSPEAELDDGQVDLVIIRDGDAGDIASLTSQYWMADYLDHELTVFRRARRLTITADPPLPLTSDGDEVGQTAVTVTVRPQALRVLAPVGIV